MHLYVKKRKKILRVGRNHNEVILVSVAPHRRIARATQSHMRYCDPITSKGCQAGYQRRRQVLIEKKSQAGFMPPSRAQVQEVSVDDPEVDSCGREWKQRPDRGR
jgi:hypothetical protein